MSHLTFEAAELVDLFCEADIAPQQAARLEALVAKSHKTRQYLLDCFDVHCELAWELGRESEDVRRADPFDDVPDPCSSEPSRMARCGHAGAEYRLA